MASSPNIADRAALIEALPVGALLADGSGRILAANGAACRLLGLSREGLLATGLFEPRWKVQARDGGRAPTEGLSPLVPPEACASLARHPLGFLEDGGATRWVILGCQTLPDGALLATLEEEPGGLARSLEQQLEARTRQLESADQELEAFTRSVSHDLKAPLRAISGFTEALLREHDLPLTGRGWDHLQRVQAAAGRMGQLLEGLLRLSRVGRDDLAMLKLDLGDLARQAFDRLCAADSHRRVVFRIAGPLPVAGDPRLLRTLMEALLDNAWKFTAHTPEPAIDLQANPAGAGFLELALRDNGAGFPASQAHRLFTPFRRLHRPDEYPGTGIGLALAKRIVSRHGGRIRAEGGVGQGAAVIFTLPGGHGETP